MEIPPEVIANSLSGFCICYFKNATHAPEAPPHYHVTIPITDDSSLLFCIVTSQVENKAWYYKKNNENALASLVAVNKSTLSFLKKESLIDCNQPVHIHKSKFSRIVDPDHNFKVICRDIPDDLKKRIVDAVKASPIVKPFIKKMVK